MANMAKTDLEKMAEERNRHLHSVVKAQRVELDDIWYHMHSNFKRVCDKIGLDYAIPQTDADQATQDENDAAQQAEEK